MKLRHTAVLVLTASLYACGSTQQVANTAPPTEAEQADESDDAEPSDAEESAEESSDAAEEEAKAPPPKAGDFFVHRYSGSYRDTPLLVEERVLSQDGELSTTEYVFEEGDQRTTLHVRRLENDVFSVSKIEDGKEIDVSLETLDGFMAMTFFSADSNEAKLSEETITALVGGQEVEAIESSYQVIVGGEEAVLVVVTSEHFPGRDIAGELRKADGTVLYRTELVEAGHEAPKSAVAQKD